MTTPFLIPRIPTSAEYYITPAFVAKHGIELVTFANRIQVVDPCPIPKQNGFGSEILEIEDAILQKPSCPALGSTAIFKSHHRHGDVDWWAKYIDDLRIKIEHYASAPNFHLRVYVGNSMWDDLDRTGLLTENADFIKMRNSSTGWNIGNMWRILALTDKTYDFVCFEDLHHRHDLKKKYRQLAKDEIFANTDAPIAASLVPPPNRYHSFLVQQPQSMWDEIERHYYLPVMSMLPIANFLKTKIFEWFIRPQQLALTGAELEDIILRVMNEKQSYKLYDPDFNRWTYMQPFYQFCQQADSAEQVMFYFMRKIKMKLWVRDEHIKWYKDGYKRFGNNFFMKRLMDQIPCDWKVGHLGMEEWVWDK